MQHNSPHMILYQRSSFLWYQCCRRSGPASPPGRPASSWDLMLHTRAIRQDLAPSRQVLSSQIMVTAQEC